MSLSTSELGKLQRSRLTVVTPTSMATRIEQDLAVLFGRQRASLGKQLRHALTGMIQDRLDGTRLLLHSSEK